MLLDCFITYVKKYLMTPYHVAAAKTLHCIIPAVRCSKGTDTHSLSTASSCHRAEYATFRPDIEIAAAAVRLAKILLDHC